MAPLGTQLMAAQKEADAQTAEWSGKMGGSNEAAAKPALVALLPSG